MFKSSGFIKLWVGKGAGFSKGWSYLGDSLFSTELPRLVDEIVMQTSHFPVHAVFLALADIFLKENYANSFITAAAIRSQPKPLMRVR